MYLRIISFSSRPIVETEALARKCCPTRFRFPSMNVRAMWIALFLPDEAEHLRD